jgi:hypothetical protein
MQTASIDWNITAHTLDTARGGPPTLGSNRMPTTFWHKKLTCSCNYIRLARDVIFFSCEHSKELPVSTKDREVLG